MPRVLSCFILILILCPAAAAQNPLKNAVDAFEVRFSDSQPAIQYTIHVNPLDTLGIEVEMHLRNVPPMFQVAMVKHPEYDDRYWRFIERLRVESGDGAGTIVRVDSALWTVNVPQSEAIIRYRLSLPPSRLSQRSAWRPFLTPTGGLIGAVHSFFYVVGQTLTPSFVTLDIPSGWQIATGLEPTSDPATFFAPSTAVLVDCPILIGNLRQWRFKADGVPHRVVYWPLPNAVPFDTTELVNDIHKMVDQAIGLFGRAPYREYSFLLQDGSSGALEHANSVTLGAPSASLRENPASLLEEIAHEYIHTWNLVRIRPIEYGDVSYKPQPLSKGLWWSEGMSMFYADLLLRRSGLPPRDSTRVVHLENLISRYLGNRGNSTISAERVSLAAYDDPGALGNYTASTHLQGELMGSMLDLVIRDATAKGKSIDEVMRLMFERFSGEKGFTGRDIEQAVKEVSGRDMHTFFEDHVRNGKTIDFEPYLKLIGMYMQMTWKPVVDREGRQMPDLRTYAWQPPGDTLMHLVITDPKSCWGVAGLRTGDQIISIGGERISNWDDFRRIVLRVRIGDSVSVHVKHRAYDVQTTVNVTGYKRPVVKIEENQVITERQRTLRAMWMAGK